MENVKTFSTYTSGVFTILKRWDDWHACINGDKRLWDCGATPEEAMSRCQLTHPEAYRTALNAQQQAKSL